MCLWWLQAAAVYWSRPQEAAGRPGVLQQIRRVPAIEGQTQLHLRLPAAHAGLQEEVGRFVRPASQTCQSHNYKYVIRRTLHGIC